MERGIDVDNEAGVVVIGDGNSVVSGTAPAVRSAYREQVRRIAPPELVGREEELAELAEFCRTGTGYRWWRADAWAGKTALMAWFALAPPEGVRIVPFFVTARLGAQNDVAAYADVVLEQLAELAGEGLPALLTAATREAHLLRLYASAAEACAARGERLVLLVDGLDEDRGVTTGPDAHSIAALLPYGAPDLPVVVSGRLHPPLPADVPGDHPLRDPSIVRLLASSPKARAIRAEAERELKHFLTGGGLPYELLGLLTAAGGGLTADDLAELTDEVPYRVRDVLRTGPGRTFALRGDAYLLAHEELVVQAREMLGGRELGRWRGALRDWAEHWRERGWPQGSPAYLLHGWFPMLRAAGDPDAMAACALDAVRHDRLLAATGGDGAALGEITAAGEALLERGDRPGLVVTLLELALRRAALRDRNGRMPAELPVAWAELGEADRGLALARGLEPVRRIPALCGIARFLHAEGDAEGARALLAEAETSARAVHDVVERPSALGAVGDAWLAVGEADGAEGIVRELGEVLGSRLLLDLVAFRCRAGEFRSALDTLDAQGPLGKTRTEDEGRAIVCAALAGAGREAEALDLARSAHGAGHALALVRIAAGVREGADALVAEGLDALPAEGWAHRSGLVAGLIEALVVAGAGERAEALLPGRKLPLVRGLVRTGAFDRAEALIDRIDSFTDRDDARTTLIEARARAGAVEGLGSSLAELTVPSSRSRAVRAVIGALVRAGRVEETEALVAQEAPESVHSRTCLARALAAAGHRERSVALLGRVEEASRAPRREEVVRVLAVVAEALALTGHRERARALTGGLRAATDEEPEVLAVVRALLATGRLEEARLQVRGAPARQLDHLSDLLARALGDPEASGPPGRSAAEWGEDRPIDEGVTYHRLPAPEGGVGVVETERRAASALALHAEGRSEEAARELTRAVAAVRGALRYTAASLPAIVRAQKALGRTEETAELLREATLHVKHLDGSRERSFLVEALVADGQHEEAVALVWKQRYVAEDLVVGQLDLVGILARAGRHELAEDLLARLSRRGVARARAYADLALAHPDPARTRELTALALHIGPWYEALPAVLRYEPGALPLVLAEAERLHRALEV
ncbi:hypothetical protein GCM10010497_07390 [Streptomyces cinereoruber]|uniref:NACHT domain-containing protein n=1 Tax=Streptomyces cinereoruber TaxID=67260 RepID=A0AAV4KCK3_9ACTN|nr:hypothetical protein [Streptomyces cinereoruber]MBB4157074.1 hypothetical protein [Streptomyces cinereoruber]MBY8815107.1 hypothetical protein [Streptomyces cinereoruber]NIH59828.1 hypothetical protein [Streptomyces cinereoruber]GGR08163.1 hypothetical protein GCM10010497_07390 [Streptomyces cinereoruber]